MVICLCVSIKLDTSFEVSFYFIFAIAKIVEIRELEVLALNAEKLSNVKILHMFIVGNNGDKKKSPKNLGIYGVPI